MSIALLALALVQAEPDTVFTVNIEPAESGAPLVEMSLAFTGDADGETILLLPDAWGGEEALWRAVADLAVEGEEARLVEGDDPARRTIVHAPGAALSVSWRVVQDREGGPSLLTNDYYRPSIEPDFVHIIGYTAIVRPERDDDTPVAARLSAPDGWALASDIEHDGLTLGGLENAILAAGDFRITELDFDGAPVRLAVRGPFDDAALARTVEAATAANLAYWGDAPEPYLVTAIPFEVPPGATSLSGTNLDDAFALFGSEGLEPDIYERLLTHEHAHTWVPTRLGGAISGEQEPAGYWFSEGFTDFLTTRASLLGGLTTPTEALQFWNEILDEYMASPVRAAANSDLVAGFWSDPNLQRLPYLRGQIFAALAEHHIREETNGRFDLDDVLAHMRATAELGPAPLRFVAAARESTGVDLANLFERHIVAGEPIALPASAFGPCGQVEQGEALVFVYGMTLDRNEAGETVVAEVDPEGPAAGVIEPGMAILERIAGAVGDAEQDSGFRVRDSSGTEREVFYRPTLGETALVQRITPADADLSANGCAALLAGRPLD